ncbi:MAG: YerC/YecD family TrpR-related protein [Parcubacteria group bacterium]|jgi:TrpR-related protein YerC/YecD
MDKLKENTSKKESVNKKDLGKMFYKLCLAVSKIKKPEEIAGFLSDLLTVNEVKMISKRLKIAEMILDGFSYEEIKDELKVGDGTIARVREWLNISGEGYRKAVEITKGKDIVKEDDYFKRNFSNIKKKYPMYYWPEIVLENIIKNSNKKQREEIRKVVEQMNKMKEKTDLYKKLKRMTKYF